MQHMFASTPLPPNPQTFLQESLAVWPAVPKGFSSDKAKLLSHLDSESGQGILLDEHQYTSIDLAKQLSTAQLDSLAVGDRLILDKSGHIQYCLPRKSGLVRLCPNVQPLVPEILASNVDLAVIVISPHSPELSLSTLDRFLLICLAGKVRPLICLNKIDLLPDEQRADIDKMLHFYCQTMKIAMVETSVSKGLGLRHLREHISNKTVIFLGNSGVGKSSLVSCLHGSLQLQTQPVNVVSQQGQHTTIYTDLYELNANTRLIDTPGVDNLGLNKLTLEELRFYFANFAAYSRNCRYAHCSHTTEPNCAVREAVVTGGLPDDYYQLYLRVMQHVMDRLMHWSDGLL